MKTLAISEDEYLQIQQNIRELKKQAEMTQDSDFIKRISSIYESVCERQGFTGNKTEKIPLKRGSGQGIITYIAEDFDDPLDDFREYNDKRSGNY